MQSRHLKSRNNQITGEWHHNKTFRQLIVICHGYQGSSEDPTIVAITKGLNKLGYNTFTFNFSGNVGGFDIEQQVKDIREIAVYFKQYSEIILLAGSFGALPASIATIQIPNITALITLNGFFGSGKVGHEHRRSYVKFRAAALIVPKYRKILRYFKGHLLPERITVPVLVIHSKSDEYVFIEQSQEFYERVVAPKRFIELKTANHGVKDKSDREKVVAAIGKWLADNKQR